MRSRQRQYDAVNGGQLYSVIEEFSKLGVNVLGAEVDSTDKKFKPTTFPKLNAKDGGRNTNVAAPEAYLKRQLMPILLN